MAKAFLDYFRKHLAINTPCLQETVQQQLRKRVSQEINDQWYGEDELFWRGKRFILTGLIDPQANARSLGERSLIGRYLRRELSLSPATYWECVTRLVDILCAQGLLVRYREKETEYVQLEAAALVWRLGDGTPPLPDPIYSRRVASPAYLEAQRKINVFFRDFYRLAARRLQRMNGKEHTAQISYEERQKREDYFRKGILKCLFCSPTMELGIDISDLQVVHLRNVPPTPANYAQRSGRAGRRGDPALVLTYCAARSGHDQYFFRHREAMVAGAVQSPRIDLGNEDLIRAHVHAIWLAKTGLPLQSSIADLLETGFEGHPLKEEVKDQINLSEERLKECIREARAVLTTCEPDLAASGWYSDEWLEATIHSAAKAFDNAFERWRELYRAAMNQLQEAQHIYYHARRRDQQEEARQKMEEANRQRNLLLNEAGREESDFYPYRYLASEGFLPGYNFPRLPLRAYIPRGDGEFIARPRFLAISEFGPRNIIYHDGAKYEVVSFILPPGGLEARRKKAKVCHICGFYHEEPTVDLCTNCVTRLDASNSEVVVALDMPSVKTRRRERITCEEEERARRGYRIQTYFSFAPGSGSEYRMFSAEVRDDANMPVLRMVYAPSAWLYRLNHGWQNRPPSEHFLINLDTGELWRGAIPGEEEGQTALPARRETLRLVVRDTKNVLLIYFLNPDWRGNENFMATLQYALQRGMEKVFQVEEEEIASERIGAGEFRAILFWEAAEGGVGILRQLVDDHCALALVAQAALERCHFGEGEKDTCVRACYECLLSYTNQSDHSRLDRHLVRDALKQLANSVTHLRTGQRSYEEQYRWLRSLTDSRSELERRLVDHLYQTKRRLPDDAQKMLKDYPAIPDFFYEPNVCIYCDGSVHDEPQQKEKDRVARQELKELGYRVVVVRYDRDLEEQVREYPDVFGEGRK